MYTYLKLKSHIRFNTGFYLIGMIKNAKDLNLKHVSPSNQVSPIVVAD